MDEDRESLIALLFALPTALWRHPNGKPAYVLGCALIALATGWLTTGVVLIWLAYMGWLLFGEA